MSRRRVAIVGLGAALAAGGCSTAGSRPALTAMGPSAHPALLAGDGLGRAVFAEEEKIAWAPDLRWNGPELDQPSARDTRHAGPAPVRTRGPRPAARTATVLPLPDFDDR